MKTGQASVMLRMQAGSGFALGALLKLRPGAETPPPILIKNLTPLPLSRTPASLR